MRTRLLLRSWPAAVLPHRRPSVYRTHWGPRNYCCTMVPKSRKKNGYHGGIAPQEVVIPLGVFVPSGLVPEGWVEVASGLRLGDRLIDADPATLSEGDSVRVVGESAQEESR